MKGNLIGVASGVAVFVVLLLAVFVWVGYEGGTRDFPSTGSPPASSGSGGQTATPPAPVTAPPPIAAGPPGPPRPAPPPRAAPPDFAAIDQALQALPIGSIAFNVSTSMTLNRGDNVHLLLSPSVPVEELQKQLAARLSGDSRVQGVEIRIAPRMEARLTGTNFSILAITPEIQAVTWNESTEWRWEVRPTVAGSQTLHLTLTAIVQIEGKDSTRAIRTFDRDIEVEVTWPQRIGEFAAGNWQWLWATAVVPAAAWLWNRRKKRRAGKTHGKPAGGHRG